MLFSRLRIILSGRRQRRGLAPHAAWIAAVVISLGLGGAAPPLARGQEDPFAAGVRPTPWRSPEEERRLFQLPPGFEIQLVAAEPDIQKPLNMAFDERGRIWLTCTVEYPYAAPPDRPGRDTIKILEDSDGDGRYEKVTTFADGLNIPIGIYPWKGGCVGFSIPNIWHFEDTDGDGVCDKRTVLYGPFDTSRDTHGMVNSFRRGWDGWVYACHGFNNDSRVKGRDGHEVHLQSGNTFRFQLDGSRIEHFTHGQVNPFGMCFDGLFNIFTADCHSKPIYQLLRGGYYPSFGKPHDGLGFVPPMMDHLHGSTAICGLAICRSANFPEKYRDDFFSGNVMTSRINRNKVEYHGSTVKAIEQPDFLVAGDPWFRPVDLHFGPDGALYVLDFYNRIIGHYEVPLTHPGRDRTSGRIWRIVYARTDEERIFPARRPGDLTIATVEELLDWVPRDDDMRPACLELCARGPESVPLLQERWRRPINSQMDNLVLLWALEAQGELSDAIIQEALDHASRGEGTYLARILSERPRINDFQRAVLWSALSDRDPFVARAAADAMARHPDAKQIWPLLARYRTSPAYDTHLRHTIRMALRDQLAVLDRGAALDALELSAADWQELAAISLGLKSPVATAILIKHLQAHDDNASAYLEHAARYAADDQVREVVRLAQAKARDQLESQGQLVLSLASGLVQRPAVAAPALEFPVELTSWAATVAAKLLAPDDSPRIAWTAVPVEGLPASETPWVVTPRASRDGDQNSLFYSSLPRGEQLTGIYRSDPFPLPERLSFWAAGHSGFPRQPLNDGNYIRLRDAQTHEILAESRPPRNDIARREEWDLTPGAGRRPALRPRTGYLELVDGDAGNAYAWLAVGRFSLEALNPSDTPRRQQLAAEIAGQLQLASLRPQLAALLLDRRTDGSARAALARALVALEPDARAAALATALADPAVPDELRPRAGYAITVRSDAELAENLREIVKRAPTRLQAALADALAGDAAGAALLLDLVESGHLAPRLLLLPSVSNKLAALKRDALDRRAQALIAALPPASETIERAIVERRRAFAQAKTDPERGRALFVKHCAACHQLAGQGSLIGPQLDGIGSRGLDRLLEDLLDPSRNVDVAFRATTLRLADGRVTSGLVRREENGQVILADSQGKELSFAKAAIEEQQKTAQSLMPSNLGDLLTAEEFADLVAYLLAQRPVPAAAQ